LNSISVLHSDYTVATYPAMQAGGHNIRRDLWALPLTKLAN